MDLVSTKIAPEMHGYVNIHCQTAGYGQLQLTKQEFIDWNTSIAQLLIVVENFQLPTTESN